MRKTKQPIPPELAAKIDELTGTMLKSLLLQLT